MALRNDVKEIINQIGVTRKTEGAGGTLFWNIKSVMRKKETFRCPHQRPL
jgi:hypothetical protein